MDVITVGEALVDWVSTEVGRDLNGACTFVKAPGGAPANVAVGLARLGVRAGFVGAFAPDAFGVWLRSILADAGVNLSLSPLVAATQTRMAFVTTAMDGDRDMAAFLSLQCADANLSLDALDVESILAAPVLHFGSVGLAAAPSRDTTLWLARAAGERGRLVSFDVNWRALIWTARRDALAVLHQALDLAHVVKLNLDEFSLLYGTREPSRGVSALWSDERRLVVVTLGAAGAWYRGCCEKLHAQAEPCQGPLDEGRVEAPAVKAVDATGAGDAFMACLLAAMVDAERGAERMPLREAVRRAAAAGALATTRVGAMSALPDRATLDRFCAGGEGYTALNDVV
jgi:fructokinase